MLRLWICLLVFFAPITASAADCASIYGIKIGAPLSLPWCNEAKIDTICAWKQLAAAGENESLDYPFIFPKNDVPSIFWRNIGTITIKNNAVQMVKFVTHGLSDVAAVETQLKQKFGPVAYNLDDAANLHRTWRECGGVIVLHIVVSERPDQGIVYLWAKQWDNNRAHAQPKILGHPM